MFYPRVKSQIFLSVAQEIHFWVNLQVGFRVTLLQRTCPVTLGNDRSMLVESPSLHIRCHLLLGQRPCLLFSLVEWLFPSFLNVTKVEFLQSAYYNTFDGASSQIPTLSKKYTVNPLYNDTVCSKLHCLFQTIFDVKVNLLS